MSCSEWKKFKLKDLCLKIGSGATPRGGASVYKDTGITFIRSQNVYNNEFDYEGLVYIDDNAALKLKNVELKENDVLLNITGDSVARCTIVPKNLLPARVNQHVCILRADEKKVIPFFLKSYLVSSSMQNIMLSLAQSGGTRAALTKGMIENLEIELPPLEEQEKIVDVLSSLDDKIELNNEMNKTLEDMAQSIFKRWFVDFEFPNEDGQPYKSSGGEMVESELGIIPRGWEVKKYVDISDIQYGYSFKSKLFNGNEGVPVIRIRDIANSFSSTYTTQDYNDIYRVKKNDILVGMDGEFKAHIWSGKDSLLNQRVLRIRPNISSSLAFCYFSIKEPLRYLENSKVGTTVIHLGKQDIDNIKVLYPSDDLINKYKKVSDKIICRISENRFENIYLSDLRNVILPKLMTGEIDI